MENNKIKKLTKKRNLLIIVWIMTIILTIGLFLFIRDYDRCGVKIQSNAETMTMQEKNDYNMKISKYIGECKKGTEVREMIKEVKILNEENINMSGQFISITVSNDIFKDAKELDECCNKCNFFIKADMGSWTDQKEEEEGSNDGRNVKKASEKMEKLNGYINTGKTYNVSSEYREGIIVGISISKV